MAASVANVSKLFVLNRMPRMRPNVPFSSPHRSNGWSAQTDTL